MTIHTATESPRTARSITRRKHLLQTARTLFIEKGFHKTGVAQISAASGVGVGQIYRDFTNKEAIISAICETDLNEWLQENSLCNAIESGDRDAIFAWIDRMAQGENTTSSRRLMCELLAEVGRNSIIAEINTNVENRIHPLLLIAIKSLIPEASEERVLALMNFISAISWGISARMELGSVESIHNVQAYASELLRKELNIPQKTECSLPAAGPHAPVFAGAKTSTQ